MEKRYGKACAERIVGWALGLVLAAALAGCGWQSQETAGAEEAAAQEAGPGSWIRAGETQEEAFDRLCLELFTEYAASDGITLHFTLADPAAYGIEKAESAFGEVSLDAVRESFEEDRELLEKLDVLEEEELSEEQRLCLKIMREYLEGDLEAEGLELYSEPFSATIGVQAQLPMLLAEYSLESREDVEDYLDILGEIDGYYEQLLAFEREKAEAGLFMGEISAEHVIESCEAYLEEGEGGMLDETFRERLDEVEGLTEEEKEAYAARNLEIIQEDFVPAYELVLEGMEELKGQGKNELGLCYLPEGKQYYEYLVLYDIATSYESVEALEEAIAERIDEEMEEMYQIIGDDMDVLDELAAYEFFSEDPVEILEYLRGAMEEEFPVLPDYQYEVKYVPEALEESLSPAFFLTPRIDRPQDNVIYINRGNGNPDLLATLAHEGFPGHLYQTTWFANQDAAEIRHAMDYSSYSEGWASYVESLSYQFAGNGLSENVGRVLALNSSVSMGLYALADIRINYEGWDRQETAEFFAEIFGVPEEAVSEMFDAYVDNPGNYLTYYTGYLEFVQMREEAEEALGEGFDAKEFHRFIVDLGPAPFTVVREYFSEWLRQQGAFPVQMGGRKAA